MDFKFPLRDVFRTYGTTSPPTEEQCDTYRSDTYSTPEQFQKIKGLGTIHHISPITHEPVRAQSKESVRSVFSKSEDEAYKSARASISEGTIDVIRIPSDLIPVILNGEESGPYQPTAQDRPQPRFIPGSKTLSSQQTKITEILDAMGLASAGAQGLKQPITSGLRLRMQPGHVVYLCVDRHLNKGKGEVMGLLKMGPKHLYLLDERGGQRECEPMCLLDFYVHESKQRCGIGKRLSEAMLKDLNVSHPQYIAIDRPSPKLINFMRRHYDLEFTIPQVNHYVIYRGFFQNMGGLAAEPPPERKARIRGGKLIYD